MAKTASNKRKDAGFGDFTIAEANAILRATLSEQHAVEDHWKQKKATLKRETAFEKTVKCNYKDKAIAASYRIK